MNLRKIIFIQTIIVILIFCLSLNVFAGTYTTTASLSVTPGAPTATVTNNAGKQWTDNVFRFSSPQVSVSRIDWTMSFSVTQSMQIWYTLDGTTFISAAIISFTANVEKTVTINFATPKTVYGMIVGPSTSTWPGYSITWYPPTLTYTLTDNTPPSISAAASTIYEIYNIITVNISDSQSNVALTKWAAGTQTVGYFSTGGTTFTGNSITVYSNGYYTIYAKDNAGNAAVYNVLVSYVDNTVTITHPISIDYTINPNNTTPFTCPDIIITNNSNIKVAVSVQQLNAIAGGSMIFNDVSPTKYSSWNTLTAAQTKSDIALGIKVKEASTGTNTWYSISNSSTLYAVNITSKTLLGILNPNGAAGNLSVSAYCGIAWDNSYTAQHNLILVFDAV